MAYIKMKPETIYEIYKRSCAGHKISKIAECTDLDRKTVRHYIAALNFHGLSPGKNVLTFQECIDIIHVVLKLNKRNLSKPNIFDIYKNEILEHVFDQDNPVKPKYAFEIIKQKYNLQNSYSAFKRYIKKTGLLTPPPGTITRIEVPAGQEIQLDYGQVGLIRINESGKRKVVYAFCGVLSHSRLPFIQFVFKQNQTSFIQSNIDMFEYFDGVTEIVICDNLKNGVIKPDLYDPLLNKAYSEMADHYKFFIDPSRVRKATDKGKIERFIPTARQVFRMLIKLHPNASLDELNEYAKEWCLNVYGMKKHGTTQIEPKIVYEECERTTLKQLPVEKFEIPVWKEATVHPDQFVQFEKKTYGLPEEYRGALVWVRRVKDIVRIFYDSKQIRQFVVPHGYRAYDKNDFQATKREMMDSGYSKYLLSKARKISSSTHTLVEQVLMPNAYLNYRRVQSILDVAEQYQHTDSFEYVINQAIKSRIITGAQLKKLFEREEQQLKLKYCYSEVGVSEGEKEMMHDLEYYIEQV